MIRPLVTLLSLAGLAGTNAAQAVHVVDAGGSGAFLDIQSAVDAAASGDLVLVRSGAYAGFAIDGKGLVVAADAGAAVTVTGTVAIENVGVGDEVVVQGLDVTTGAIPFLGEAVLVDACVGQVLFQDVDVAVGPATLLFQGAFLVYESSAVALVDSSVDASQAVSGLLPGGIVGVDSNLYLHSSQVLGQSGADGVAQIAFGSPGGPGVSVRGGSVLAVDSVLVGGDGGDANPILQSGDGGDGGAGLRLDTSASGSPTAVAYGSNLAGGSGGAGFAPGVDGTDGATSDVVAGTLDLPPVTRRRFDADPVVRDGETTALVFTGEAFDLVWHVLALDTNPLVAYLPDALGAIHPGGNPFLFKFRGVLNATGQKTLNVTLTPSGLPYLPFYEQALMYSATDGFVASGPRYVAFLDGSLF